jgi:hypothetical protein
MNSNSYREIALYITGKRDYENIIADLVQIALHFKVKYIVPEKNSMSMQISVLHTALLEAFEGAEALARGWQMKSPRIAPFIMTNKKKDDLVKLFQQGINDGLQLLDEPISKHEARIFQAQQTPSGLWTYAAPVGSHDDTIITRMLANLACYQLRDSFK